MIYSASKAFKGVDVVLESDAICGECPRWSSKEQVLYWVDIDGKTLNKYYPTSGNNLVYNVEERIGSFAFRSGGGLVSASERGFNLLTAEGTMVESLCQPEAKMANTRFNDGRCDPAGRFWAGTMDQSFKSRTGSLYKLNADHSAEQMACDVIVSNGLAFSPDGRIMYWSDSRRSIVFAFDFDVEDGVISGKRVFIESTQDLGRPDGAAIDVDGCYWSAGYAGGSVVRYNPSGEIDRIIRLPVSQVTMCTFGGARFDTLFITSARIGMNEEALAQEPLSGSIFAILPGIHGLPEPEYLG